MTSSPEPHAHRRPGQDTVYAGKGKWAKDVDAKKFAARDNLLTGGWAAARWG